MLKVLFLMRLGLDYLEYAVYNKHTCPNSLVVKHVLGKDESQVRFLLRAPLKNSLCFLCQNPWLSVKNYQSQILIFLGNQFFDLFIKIGFYLLGFIKCSVF